MYKIMVLNLLKLEEFEPLSFIWHSQQTERNGERSLLTSITLTRNQFFNNLICEAMQSQTDNI